METTEDLTRAIATGTASVTGQDFFDALTRLLSSELGIRYAFVAECLPNGRARSLSFWNDGRLGENFDYDLNGTPCLSVVAGDACFHPHGLAELFPTDDLLHTLRAESYHGVPVFDSSRRVIGHLVVMDDRPLVDDGARLRALETFAERTGAELERMRSFDDVRRLNLELDALLEINRAIGRHLDRDELFGALAACLKNVVATDRFGIEIPIEGDRLQGHILTPLSPGVEPTRPTVLPAPGTACSFVLDNRVWIVASSREELAQRFPVTFDVMKAEGMESLCALPLVSGDRCLGALFFMAANPGAYDRLRRGFLEQVAGAVAVALDDFLAHEEVSRLRDRLAAENLYLQEEIRRTHGFDEVIGESPALLAVLEKAAQVAPTESTVLIYGETGTGKELIARAIHDRSRRRDRALVKVNCSAISTGLAESELFGHVKGAFTGAVERRLGRFEVANGGTLFLDEVGELSLDTQVKLLRVLQEGEFEPVGTSRSVRVNVRVIAATNRNLEQAMEQGRFRPDLFYRLNVFPVEVPPLRERASDIPGLLKYFLSRYSLRVGKRVEAVTPETMERLLAYRWPGNIRELQNIVERAVVLAQGPVVDLDPGLLGTSAPIARSEPAPERRRQVEPAGLSTLKEMERQHILAALAQTRGVIHGPAGAARILNLHPNTLRSRMQRLGIPTSRPEARKPRTGPSP